MVFPRGLASFQFALTAGLVRPGTFSGNDLKQREIRGAVMHTGLHFEFRPNDSCLILAVMSASPRRHRLRAHEMAAGERATTELHFGLARFRPVGSDALVR